MSTPQNGAQSADSETTALLEHGKLHSQESTMSQRCTRYMHATGFWVGPSPDNLSHPANFPDSSSIFIWGCFTSMQTGNSIYLGLGLAAPDEGDRWIRSIISIVAFALGSFFFARYHRFFGGRKRWVMASSFLIQSCFVAAAALVVTVGPELDVSDSFTFWVGIPIALIAFQSGGQAVISRVLEMGSLSSVVVTAVLCDLFSDQHLFAARNVDRNRRLAAPLLLILGAYGGGMWARSSIGILGSLWTVVVLKGMLAVVWMLWSAEKEEEA